VTLLDIATLSYEAKFSTIPGPTVDKTQSSKLFERSRPPLASAHHNDVIILIQESLSKAKKAGTLIDFRVSHCGDDLNLIMTHDLGENASVIHKLAWDTFVTGTEVAKKLHLYGAGQDLLADAFSGNVKGMGPGCAEMEFVERKAETILVFMADKCAPGAWNFPLYKMFADPFTTPGLVIDPKMHDGFTFQVLDGYENKTIDLSAPKDIYDLLAFIGTPGRFMINHITRNGDDEIASAGSTQKLSLIAGKYVGKDDPVLIVRSQAGFPAVGEVLEAFTFPHITAGWMRGSHNGPLMPVSVEQSNPTRFDGPPRVVCLGFQLADGTFVGPRDMFNDVSFDNARAKALDIADILRQHGPFEPHRLPNEEMEYTTLPQIKKRLEGRFVSLDSPSPTINPSRYSVISST